MALMSALTDNFNDNSFNTSRWYTYITGSVTIAEQNERLEIALPSSATAGTTGGIANQTPRDFRDQMVMCKIIQTPSDSTDANMSLIVYDDGGGTGSGSYNACLWVKERTTLYAQRYIAGVKTTITSFAFNLTTHKYWRIRESSGTIYWDTSTDGLNWTNRASNAPAITWTNANVNMQANCYKAETNPGTAIFDNFNLPNLSMTPTGIVTSEAFGTAQIGEDVTVTVSGIASAEAFGDPNLLYNKVIIPDSIDDSAVGTPAVTAALLSSTGYNEITKPTTDHNAVVAGTVTVGGLPIGLLLALTYSTITIAKNTTGFSNITKPTTAYNGEVL